MPRKLKGASNVVQFPTPLKPPDRSYDYQPLDINKMVTGGKEGYTAHDVSCDQTTFCFKNSRGEVEWVLTRIGRDN